MGDISLPPFLITNPYFEDMSIMTESILTKVCTKCNIEKTIDDFYKDSCSRDGLESRCKKCQNERRRIYYENNKEKVETYAKQYRGDNRNILIDRRKLFYQKNRKTILIKKKEYDQENKERISDYGKQYWKDNKEHIIAYNKRYRQTEAGKIAQCKSSSKRKALKRGVTVEDFNSQEIFKRDGYICQSCGCKTRPSFNRFHPKRPELDHIIPLSLGGEHSKRNTQCLCRHCNATKYNTGTGDQMRLFG